MIAPLHEPCSQDICVLVHLAPVHEHCRIITRPGETATKPSSHKRCHLRRSTTSTPAKQFQSDIPTWIIAHVDTQIDTHIVATHQNRACLPMGYDQWWTCQPRARQISRDISTQALTNIPIPVSTIQPYHQRIRLPFPAMSIPTSIPEVSLEPSQSSPSPAPPSAANFPV
jgi:hypothetical protein